MSATRDAPGSNRVPGVTDVTFCTVGTTSYFPGLVGLLNSLRLTGNAGDLVVLDVDLSPAQRQQLLPHCRLVSAPNAAAVNPLLLKAFPASLALEGIVVVIDCDVIVTGSLDPLVQIACEGQISAYPDTDDERWFPEWHALFELQSPLRRQQYVNTGVVALSVAKWPHLLTRWLRACESIPTRSTRAGGSSIDTPLWDGDQDALNAILMSEIPEGAVRILPATGAPTNDRDRLRVRVVDIERLECTFEGLPTLLLHSAGTPKPWQLNMMPRNLETDSYLRLLPRVLFREDLLVRLDPTAVPVWLRPGRRARLAANYLEFAHALRRRCSMRARPRSPAS